MRIGELSRRTGASVRSLRYYEEQGLLNPVRLPSGYRDYDEGHASIVRGIRLMLAAGLNTATIAELLPCMSDDGQVLRPACSLMLSDLNRERARLSDAVAGLMAARDALDVLIDATASLQPADPLACQATANPNPSSPLTNASKDLQRSDA
ncbi:MerR family transcriptional regulator [Nonomuraea diastatica]|uniref:MerR family transcriptional regulator n=1 Tax=Nonomuraea diastatica TaxID=1848329 RepID=A0A4V6PD24_9ACTN|nr:MerR family transcriptional regulator [Nonomuraea diastatica]TDD19406.1 MerR family transcriptional regulator [Nonomuraea diastatica]